VRHHSQLPLSVVLVTLGLWISSGYLFKEIFNAIAIHYNVLFRLTLLTAMAMLFLIFFISVFLLAVTIKTKSSRE